ncbi:hypothetical protein F5882DRAFT_421541 [Hyaloscypha sp. PMI_1271]|nr:hypothetical protein F5882DRAFT_421541 [Hyaloscypha sp. PMI_1271]
MACTPKRKTSRREYETPRRSRFRAYLKEGHLTSRAAHLAKEQPSRPLIISDEKMKEITKWITGYFNRRAMPLRQITEVFDIKATNKTLLNAFARLYYNETTVQSTLRRRLKILRKRGERRRLDYIQFKFQSSRTSIHHAAVIRYNFKKQILRGLLGDICKERNSRYIGDFCIGETYFVVEDRSKVYRKKDTKGNQGLYNKARRILKQRLRNRKPYSGWSLEELQEDILNIWDYNITVEDFNKYIDSLPERLEKV